jgi:hypothetical protein
MSDNGPKAVGLLSGDRPEEAIDQRACVEWQGSTQNGPVYRRAARTMARKS